MDDQDHFLKLVVVFHLIYLLVQLAIDRTSKWSSVGVNAMGDVDQLFRSLECQKVVFYQHFFVFSEL